jgi:hypothetical protein
MRNTALPCSVGIVDVRNLVAWIYSAAEKEALAKSKCHKVRVALAVGSRRWLMLCLVCWLSYRRLKLICSIELPNVQVSDTTEDDEGAFSSQENKREDIRE